MTPRVLLDGLASASAPRWHDDRLWCRGNIYVNGADFDCPARRLAVDFRCHAVENQALTRNPRLQT